MKSSRLLVTGGLLVLLLFSPASSAPADFSGLTITGIEFKDEYGNSWPQSEGLLELTAMKQGDRFSGAAVREGLSMLFLKGLFEDIRVEAFPDNGGVRLEYLLFQKTLVSSVEIHGNKALSTDALRDLLAPLEGKEPREEKLAVLKDDLLALCHAEGYYGAKAAFRAEPLKGSHRVILHVDIRESAPTLIEEITFSGNTIFKDKDLLKVLKSKRGAPLKRDLLLDTDRTALLNKYAEAGYPARKPGTIGIRFENNKAFVNIQVNEGPRVTVSFTGNREFGSDALSQALLIWPERDVSDSLLDSGMEKIKTLYREKGYADVAIDLKKTESPGRLDLDFTVREGMRTTVRTISFKGNAAFTAEELGELMALRESGWFFSQPFREDLLARDLDSLRDHYLEAGYLSTTIKKNVIRSGEENELAVELDIVEGPLTRTGVISFEGNKTLSSAELLSLANLKQGAPFNERIAEEDRYRILSAYTGKGYLYARVDAEKTAHDDRVDIRYRIAEDLPVFIGRILLRGNEQTRSEVIMRELLVKPGDFYDYGAILASQQRIYRFGYFRTARFEPARPGEKEYVKNMLFTVEEGPAGAVELGAGYGDLDRLRGFVEVSHRNVWGAARYSSLRFEQSSILQRAIFNFQEPWFLGRKLENTFSLVWSDSAKLNSDTRELYYETRKTVASFGVEKSYEALKPSLTYQFENVVNYNVKPEAQLTPEDSGRVLVSSLIPALIWDLRDDVFNPRKGALYGVILKEALRELGSEADFSKLTVQGSWFLPVGKNVLALSARAGTAWPFRSTQEVPLHERFYLGGSTTVRGFQQDSIGPSSVGPDGELIPTGGSSMAALNLELRINPGEGFGLVLFYDAGNVWTGQSINLSDLRASYGPGIRYGTPVGPLSIDYGQKVKRLPGESPGEFHFNIGNTF